MSNFLNSIYYYTNYETKNWKKVLELAENEAIDINEKRRLSWIWPSLENLNELKLVLRKFNIQIILSIGCGSGLFEWILRESIGLRMYGLEKDPCWWESKYAVKRFIKQSYIDNLKPNCLPETFMQICCDIHEKNNWKFAIMFSYFNNRTAFLNYLKMYKGEWIIIAGPQPNVDIHTDPSPLEPNFPNETEWKLCAQLYIGVNDMIAIYRNHKIFMENEKGKQNKENS